MAFAAVSLFVLFPRSGTSYASPKKNPACGGHAQYGDPKMKYSLVTV
jgi:hypothetical protein